MIDVFNVLIIVVVSEVYASLQTHQDVRIKCVQFFLSIINQ